MPLYFLFMSSLTGDMIQDSQKKKKPFWSRWGCRSAHKPIWVIRTRSRSVSCSVSHSSLSSLRSPTHDCSVQWHRGLPSPSRSSLSENRAQGFYINNNTSSAFLAVGGWVGGWVGGGRKTQASVFVCILFPNIKLNQSFNTPDCINTGEKCLNKYQEWKWISRRRLLSTRFIYEYHCWRGKKKIGKT